MLKQLITQYRGVFKFLGIFLGSYLLLTLMYNGYLMASANSNYPPDFITHLVAKQCNQIINQFGYNAQVIPDTSQPMMQLYVNNTYVARIIEGCNALSIIVLFSAFIIAFRSTFKRTLFFVFAGSVLIYAVNLLRIAILAVALYEYPEQESLLHGVIFPGLIYGMVFLLWFFWVKNITLVKSND